MKNFPFLSVAQAMLLLRVAIAVMLMAHAITRIANGTIPRFAGFLVDKGLMYGLAVGWAITVVGSVCGSLLIAGKYTRWAAAGLMVICIGGIVIVHAAKGWFVGEHGAGGVEYSIVLFVACVVIAAGDKGRAGARLA